MSTVFEAADPGQVEDALRAAYGSVRIDARGQRGGMRMEQVSVSPLARFDRNTFGMTLDVTGDPLGLLAIGHLRSGLARYGTGGSERSYRPGDVFLAVRPGQPHAGRAIDIDTELTVIDPVLLSQVADTVPCRTPQLLRLTGCDPISAASARLWLKTCAYVRDTLLAAPDASAERLVVACAEQLLASVALAVFPSNASADPTSADQHDASQATLRRAVTLSTSTPTRASPSPTSPPLPASRSARSNSPSAATSTSPRTRTCAGFVSTRPAASWPPQTRPGKLSPRSRTGGAFPARAGSLSTTARPTALTPAEPSTPTRSPDRQELLAVLWVVSPSVKLSGTEGAS